MLPEIATANPGYVNDLIAVDTGRGTVDGDIGALQTVIQLRGYAYLAGGRQPLGIALFRAHVPARWAAALLAVGGLLSVVLSLMPDAFYRFLAVPLGVSLWRSTWTELNDANIGSVGREPITVREDRTLAVGFDSSSNVLSRLARSWT